MSPLPRFALPLLLAAACTDDGGGTLVPDPPDEVEETAPPVDDTDAAPVDTPPADDTDADVVDTDPPEPQPAPPPETAADCFAGQWGANPPVDYDQYAPVIGSHCMGTNHQDIADIERVVFVGDSITVGTLPTTTPNWYRNQLADVFSRRWGLRAPSLSWRNADPFNGTTLVMESGDFASCAKYGARTDDLLMDPHRQLETCMPEDKRHLRTLVVMTIGGNDIYSLLEDVRLGVDDATLHATYDRATQLLRESIAWIKEPGRFPNGVSVIFGNTYDFTDLDGGRDMSQCEGAQLIGMDGPLLEPITWDILSTAQEQYMSIAVETQTDMMFLGEQFCGHGWDAGNPNSRCYRGPNAATWLDFTCEHPNALGHDKLREMVLAVVDE
jgi:lysophospholipase L1-like esterase